MSSHVWCKQCGRKAEEKTFTTFSYLYCNTCKVEVDAWGNTLPIKDINEVSNMMTLNPETAILDPLIAEFERIITTWESRRGNQLLGYTKIQLNKAFEHVPPWHKQFMLLCLDVINNKWLAGKPLIVNIHDLNKAPMDMYYPLWTYDIKYIIQASKPFVEAIDPMTGSTDLIYEL